MASKQQIMDRAAGLIGAERILDPNSSSLGRERRIVGLYPTVYEEVLALWPWTCARGRHKLPAEAEPPAWGFKCKYALPGGVIQVAAAMTGGAAWEVEGRHVLTDFGGPLNLLTTDRVEEAHLHPLVAKLIAVALAGAAAAGASDSTTLQDRMLRLYQDAFIEAAASENSQGSSLDKLGSGWVLAMQTAYAPELAVAGALPPPSWLQGV